jgi:hypothetical protein
MPKIFISYRREDAKYPADRLHGILKKHVRDPKRDIFIDIDNIPAGVNFAQHLDAQVSQCDVLLALIGSGWTSATNPKTGKRRLEDPRDFVRIEIASALKRGIKVAPVLLDGVLIPSEDELPDDLKGLVLQNGGEIRRESFDSDAERLIRKLDLRGTRSANRSKPSVSSKPPGMSAQDTQPTGSTKSQPPALIIALASMAVLLTSIAGWAFLFGPLSSSGRPPPVDLPSSVSPLKSPLTDSGGEIAIQIKGRWRLSSASDCSQLYQLDVNKDQITFTGPDGTPQVEHVDAIEDGWHRAAGAANVQSFYKVEGDRLRYRFGRFDDANSETVFERCA